MAARLWLVTLDQDLRSSGTSLQDVLDELLEVDGVQCVTDIRAISRETLDEWLLPEEQTWSYQQRERKRNRPKS